MKIAHWHGGTKFTVDEVPDPVAAPGQVVVRVHTVGLCGTEIHMTQRQAEISPPRVIGHEYSGAIVEVGPDVERSRIGQRVVCEPSYGCGKCETCGLGAESECTVSQVRPGGFAEYAVMPSRTAHTLPDGLDIETAAMTEPASCSLSGLEMFEMPRDATILVIGAGLLGITSMLFALRRGAVRAIVSDPVAHRREFAGKMGAGTLIDPMSADLREAVAEATGGLGVHVSFEAVGAPELLADAIMSTRKRGRVQMVGVSPAGGKLPLAVVEIHRRQLTIGAAMSRGFAFNRALAAMPELGLEAAATTRYPLERVGDAFQAAARGDGIRTVIAPNGD